MIAVLTADLVHSTKLTTQEVVEVTEWLENYFRTHLENTSASIYRGDEFQIIFKDPKDALYQVLLLKLKLQSEFEWNQACTMSIAYGNADLLTETPHTSQGPVFVASGRNLEKTKRGEISIVSPQLKTDTSQLLLKYVNHQLSKLTDSQLELLLTYFEKRFPEHKELAAITGTSRQNISNRLSAMGADLLRDFALIFSQHLD